MSKIEAIKERHSFRNYKPEKIHTQKVDLIKEKIDELNTEGNLNLQFIGDAGNTYNRFLYYGLS